MIGTLILLGKDWLVATVALAAGAFAFVAWSYLRSSAPTGFRVTCAALKLLGLLALLACLLEPAWVGQRAKPRANLIAVVADNSRSMTLPGGDDGASRGEAMRGYLTGERRGWRTRLAEDFEVRNYVAAQRLEASRDFADLDFSGRASALGEALRELVERARGQSLAGIVLLTDGIAADLPPDVDLSGLPPVFPVIFGSDEAPRDLGVGSFSVAQTAFEDAPVTVQADVNASGFSGEKIVGKVVALDDGKVASEQTLTMPKEGDRTTLRFQFRPEKSGLSFYKLEVDPGSKDAPPEATLLNNGITLAVDRGAGDRRILYVSGRPNWEYKFLHRAIEADEQTRLVGLIRIAKREPKFTFRGRTGESSNPLFRGFGSQSKEEVEQYDQPVLVRLGTEDEVELRGGFPKTAEELFKYHAVVVDDLEAGFFTPDQMALVQRFVSERGGGVLMLGGTESFREGGYQRTAINEVLPVYLDAPALPTTAGLRLALTREGWVQPWVRLRTTEADETKRLGALPAIDVLNRTSGVKPGAMVVANVTDGRREWPALVTQRFGRGRAAAMLVGDLWETALGDDARSADLAKAWRQLARWLVADVPEPIELRIEPVNDAEVKIQVRVRDAKFQPIDNASVRVNVQATGSINAPASLMAEASASEAGVYETSFTARENGGFRIEATVVSEAGASLGEAHAGWAANLDNAEFRTLRPNRELMQRLARGTGGQVIAAEKLEEFVKSLPTRKAPSMEAWTRPLWQTPEIFLFALACFAGEWGLRRWRGLA